MSGSTVRTGPFSPTRFGHGASNDDESSTALPLRVLFLDGLGILLIRGSRIVVEHAVLEQLLGRGAVRDLLIEGVGAHVFRELQFGSRLALSSSQIWHWVTWGLTRCVKGDGWMGGRMGGNVPPSASLGDPGPRSSRGGCSCPRARTCRAGASGAPPATSSGRGRCRREISGSCRSLRTGFPACLPWRLVFA